MIVILGQLILLSNVKSAVIGCGKKAYIYIYIIILIIISLF